MSKQMCLLLLSVVVAGCGSYGQNATQLCEKRLERLRPGMSKDRALSTLGYKTVSIYVACCGQRLPVKTSYPYESGLLEHEGQTFEVLYYSAERAEDAGVGDERVIPLVFEKGRLFGWGWEFFRRNFPERARRADKTGSADAHVRGAWSWGKFDYMV
jgi:hypothetical protein